MRRPKLFARARQPAQGVSKFVQLERKPSQRDAALARALPVAFWHLFSPHSEPACTLFLAARYGALHRAHVCRVARVRRLHRLRAEDDCHRLHVQLTQLATLVVRKRLRGLRHKQSAVHARHCLFALDKSMWNSW
jgi:hypothetical protein